MEKGNSSALSQGAMEIYLKSGMINGHIKRIKVLYQRKMELLQKACEMYLSANTSFTRPNSGFYLTVYLPEHVKAQRVVDLLLLENIYVDDAARMFLPEHKRFSMIRLSISQVDKDQIVHGVKQVARCIDLLNNSKDYISHFRF